jgi:conjugal transfer pilin signal peptidase TrbI
LVALFLVAVPLLSFSNRFRIFADSTVGERCLPYRIFLVDLHAHLLRRGDYVVFRSRGMGPFYPDGTLVAKLVAGVPRDHVVVDERGMWVNGTFKGSLLHAQPGGRLWKLGHRPSEFARDELVPPDHWWVIGTLPRSFDSRYWGYIADPQIVGRAIPLW